MGTIVMIAPRVHAHMSMPEEYHTTADVDCTSRETQERDIGKAMLDAIELANTHPAVKNFPELHYVVMFADIQEH